jgi:hypothetical protein
MRVEIRRSPGKTPLLVVDIPGDTAGLHSVYGHLDKQQMRPRAKFCLMSCGWKSRQIGASKSPPPPESWATRLQASYPGCAVTRSQAIRPSCLGIARGVRRWPSPARMACPR